MPSRTLLSVCSVLALSLAASGAVGTASASPTAPVVVMHGTGAVTHSTDALPLTPSYATCAENKGAPNGDGITAQDFGPNYPEYVSEGAADFTLDSECTVGAIAIRGTLFLGAATAATVWVYADEGGLPGAEVCTATVEGTGPDFVLPVEGCTLAAGSYWLGAQVAMDFETEGQWYWATTNQVLGGVDAWRNPGGGFGTTCSDWGYIDACLGFSYEYIFSIKM